MAHVKNNSGQNSWYTPAKFIDSAKTVLIDIDVDPASCEFANRTVKADTFYSAENTGLDKEWCGNVWMNPPYAQPLMTQFAEKLIIEVDAGRTKQAIVLVNNATETKWFQSMARKAKAICFPDSRIKFIDYNGNPSGAPLQGQAFLYFGYNIDGIDSFINEFSKHGLVFAPTK